MADESPRIATAYILVRARDGGSREDIRRIGQQYGEDAGKAAGVAMGEQTQAQTAATLKRDAPKFRQAGQQAGKTLGEAAGQQASKSLGQKLREGVTRITVTASDIGRQFGGELGQRASERASLSLGAGLRRRVGASGEFRALGGRIGLELGQSIGGTAGLAVLEGMRRAIASGGATVTVTASDLPRLAIGAGQAGDGAGRSFASRFGARIRDAFRGGDAGGDVFTVYGTGAGRRYLAGFGRGLSGANSVVGKVARGAGKVLESEVYQGINSGLTKALSGAGGSGDNGIVKRLFSLFGVGGTAAGLSAVGPAIVGAAAAVVDLSGALGLLPGAATAAAAGAGTLKLGLLGVGDAIEASAKGADEYKAALKGLAPSARKFVDAVVDQRKGFDSLRKGVQQNLFKGLGQDVRQLSDRYLPILKTRLSQVASGFNAGAQDLADFFETPQTALQLDRILGRDTQALKTMTATLRPVAAGLLDIADVGSTFLPGLADKAAGSIANFSAAVQRAAADGSLWKYFRDGISAVGDLTSALGGAGRIIAGFFSAGAGASASPLQTLASGLNSVADVVNTPGFQAGLRDLFDSISQAGASVASVLPDVGEALVALEPAIASLIRAGGAGLASFLESAASAAKTAAPALTALGSVLEAIAPHIGPVVLALVGLKGALLALAAAEKATLFLEALPGRITAVGTAAQGAQARLVAMRASLATLGTAAAVVGVAAGADALGDFVGKAYTSKVSADDLTKSLQSLGRGGELGAAGLELFTNKGVFGLVTNDADSTSEALHRFEVAASGAFGDSLSERAGRALDFGQALGRIKEQASQLDPALASLAKSDPGAAASAFQKFMDAGQRGGASISELTALFPQYSAAAQAAGSASGDAAGKVSGLSSSLSDLQSQVGETASKILSSRDANRGYEAAVDAASEAVDRNGKTLKVGTAAGRDNQAALDAIAAAGIRVAQQFSGDGPAAQAKFRQSLANTRSDLIQAGVRFGLTRGQAKAYADQVLQIPKAVNTTISTAGLTVAAARAAEYSNSLRSLPTNKVVTITTRFYQIGKEPGSFGNGLGVYAPQKMTGGIIDAAYPQRRAAGGLIDPRLGGPRQDNVPLWASGGEFMVNAWAVKAPGVEALLRYINTANKLPEMFKHIAGFAGGGKVAAAGSAGMNDLTLSKPARIERTIAVRSVPPSGSGPSDAKIDELIAVMKQMAAQQHNTYLDGELIARSVVRRGGGAW